jgi:DNA-binding beta-propeller fold protein YncE
MNNNLLKCLSVLILTWISGSIVPAKADEVEDKLYVSDFDPGTIGDFSDSVSTVQRFDAKTGASLNPYVTANSGGLHLPHGVIFNTLGKLLVVNQNVNLPINGEVLRYRGDTGAFLDALIPSTSEDAPLAPDGIILHDTTIFVADRGDVGVPGHLSQFDAKTGHFLRNLIPTGLPEEFHPRGLVIGPDGMLYVSVRNLPAPGGGHILRFNPKSGVYLGSFIDSTATNDLNRPDGLSFGPHGRLYVTSFRLDALDNDKILIFNGTTGAYIHKIDLDKVRQPRAFAQSLLFGPRDRLFVPIAGDGPDTGQVRRYDVRTKQYSVFIPSLASGGPLKGPQYLTFGKTDPETLRYGHED